MAVTLFQALSATGLKAFAFLQALLWFPAGVFRQALALVSAATSSPHRPSSPTLPRTSAPAAGSLGNCNNTADNDQADLHANQDSDADNTDLTMAGDTSSASSRQQQTLSKNAPLPKVVPAMPRFGPASSKENVPAASAANPAVTTNNSADEVANGVSRLSLRESAAASNRVLSASDGNAGAGSTAAPAENGGTAALSKGTFVQSNGALPDIFGGDEALATQEVTRAPAVPLTHSISQTSKLKEMPPPTIQLGDETLHILEKEETPEQAAERAVHSGFMREALDMVGFKFPSFFFFFVLFFVFCFHPRGGGGC